MYKADIDGRLADGLGVSTAMASNEMDGVFETIAEALANGDDVRIVGFGTFGTRRRPPRRRGNPRTGESVEIRDCTAPTFRPGKALREGVNAGRGS